VVAKADWLLRSRHRFLHNNPYGDGKAALRVVEALERLVDSADRLSAHIARPHEAAVP
jgi:UDP-N-acetylglucosamine 2-epimerase